ncbi:MAG: hypothetical protein NT007_17790 [Candidatus Kapabacteria bacterium]|nr:hypothetical protein [Candidatus Kapabacteria bacterium]
MQNGSLMQNEKCRMQNGKPKSVCFEEEYYIDEGFGVVDMEMKK